MQHRCWRWASCFHPSAVLLSPPEQNLLQFIIFLRWHTRPAPPWAHFRTISRLPSKKNEYILALHWIHLQDRMIMRRKCFKKKIQLISCTTAAPMPLMRCHFNKPVCRTTKPFGKHYCLFVWRHASKEQIGFPENNNTYQCLMQRNRGVSLVMCRPQTTKPCRLWSSAAHRGCASLFVFVCKEFK